MRQAIALLKRRLGPDPGSERPHPERGLPPHRWRGALRPLCDDGAPSGTMLALVPNSDEPIDELRHLPRLHVALAALGVALSAALILSGRAIAARRRHGFCLVTSFVATFFFPFGTLLGFHTIHALTAPAAREAFGVRRGAAIPTPPGPSNG